MRSESVDFSKVVAAAIGLETIACSLKNSRNHHKKGHRRKDPTLGWVLVAATVIAVCIPFVGLPYWMQKIYYFKKHGHEGGVIMNLTQGNFEQFLKDYEMAFVNFCTPLSSECQVMAPAWEEFAKKAWNLHMPIKVGSVNCMAEPALCAQERIQEHPTTRWYQDGVGQYPDYYGSRCLKSLVHMAELHIDVKYGYPTSRLQSGYTLVLMQVHDVN